MIVQHSYTQQTSLNCWASVLATLCGLAAKICNFLGFWCILNLFPARAYFSFRCPQATAQMLPILPLSTKGSRYACILMSLGSQRGSPVQLLFHLCIFKVALALESVGSRLGSDICWCFIYTAALLLFLSLQPFTLCLWSSLLFHPALEQVILPSALHSHTHAPLISCIIPMEMCFNNHAKSYLTSEYRVHSIVHQLCKVGHCYSCATDDMMGGMSWGLERESLLCPGHRKFPWTKELA